MRRLILLGWVAIAANLAAEGRETRGASAYTFSNEHVRVVGDGAGITGLSFAPDGDGRHGTNILEPGSAGIQWTADGRVFAPASPRITRKPGMVEIEDSATTATLSLSIEGDALKTTFLTPDGTGNVGVRMELPFCREGYFDRASQRNLQPDLPATSWPVKRFINLKTGHLASIEMFKRLPSLYPGGRNWLEHEGAGKYLLQCFGGFDLRLDFEHPMHFVTRDRSLVLESTGGRKREHRFDITLRPTTTTIELIDGSRLPSIEVCTSRILRNAAGSECPVGELAADLFLESLAWYAEHIANGAWGDWNVRGIAWTDIPQARRLARQLLAWPVGDDGLGRDGYAYTWQDLRGWPFPEGKDSRHTGTNAILITAAWRLYCWTGDRAFLREIHPKLRRAMEYQLTHLHAHELGIILSDTEFGPNQGGRAGRDYGTNFYDIQPFGGRDAYATILYYRSLRAMGEIERVLGNEGAARKYRNDLMPACRRSFNRVFWNDATGRYIACIDVNGREVDIGHTFLQFEAMEAGLVDAPRATRIFSWLDDPTTDTYTRWRFAARHNTVPNRDWWPPFGKWPWDKQVQNGGALLAESAFDLLARARMQGADGAADRLLGILGRYAEPDRLCGGAPLFTGERPQGGDLGAGAVGVMFSEFPETALLSEAMFTGFLGISVDAEGMTIAPALPREFDSFTIRDIAYRGGRFDISATRQATTVRCTRDGGGTVWQLNGRRLEAPFELQVGENRGGRVRLVRATAR
jgi:hypothetical protein